MLNKVCWISSDFCELPTSSCGHNSAKALRITYLPLHKFFCFLMCPLQPRKRLCHLRWRCENFHQHSGTLMQRKLTDAENRFVIHDIYCKQKILYQFCVREAQSRHLWWARKLCNSWGPICRKAEKSAWATGCPCLLLCTGEGGRKGAVNDDMMRRLYASP